MSADIYNLLENATCICKMSTKILIHLIGCSNSFLQVTPPSYPNDRNLTISQTGFQDP